MTTDTALIFQAITDLKTITGQLFELTSQLSTDLQTVRAILGDLVPLISQIDTQVMTIAPAPVPPVA